MYKILFCIENFSQIGGGATIAMVNLMLHNQEISDYTVFCYNIKSKLQNNNFNIHVGNGDDVIKYFVENEYDYIHFFKADGGIFFKDIINSAKRMNKTVPIITTVCQKPSFFKYQLSPFEIINSNCIVFIDKSSINDKMYSFIPKERKRMIYFGATDEKISFLNSIYDRQEKNEIPIIGRGSTLVKCPKDMFEVYDGISNPKEIVIVGEGDSSWIEKEAKKRSDYSVKIYGVKPYNEWLDILNKFDIFLYYLPKNIHSSIDGTLGDAMLLRKAVVYCGPAAPEERLVNRKNAIIAHSKKEMIDSCNELLNDLSLRKTLGENARESTIKDFHFSKTLANYNLLYSELRTKELPVIGIRIVPFILQYSLMHILFFIFIRIPKKIIRSLLSIFK